MDFSKQSLIAIDELQLVPGITSVIKYLYDNYPVKFVLTGSSSFYLKGQVSDSLAGRKKIFELFPLDFGEYLTFKGVPHLQTGIHETFIESEFHRLKGYYQDFISFGGFPEVVLTKNEKDKSDILSDIISSYINIDIKSLSDFRNLSMISSLLKMLAARSSTRLDISKISNLTGISRPTIMNYIELFEKTYLIHLVTVHSTNPDREIVKARKVYFSDTGILNVFANPGSGVVFENAVYLQLKHFGELKYYALKNGNEIDFICGNKAYEIKESPGTYDLDNARKTLKSTGIPTVNIIGKNKPATLFNGFIWGGNIV